MFDLSGQMKKLSLKISSSEKSAFTKISSNVKNDMDMRDIANKGVKEEKKIENRSQFSSSRTQSMSSSSTSSSLTFFKNKVQAIQETIVSELQNFSNSTEKKIISVETKLKKTFYEEYFQAFSKCANIDDLITDLTDVLNELVQKNLMTPENRQKYQPTLNTYMSQVQEKVSTIFITLNYRAQHCGQKEDVEKFWNVLATKDEDLYVWCDKAKGFLIKKQQLEQQLASSMKDEKSGQSQQSCQRR